MRACDGADGGTGKERALNRIRWAMIVVAGGFGLLFALADRASADVVDPATAHQPVSSSLMASPAPDEGSAQGEPAPLVPAEGAGRPATAPAAPAPTAPEPVPAVTKTPAPEQVVTRAPILEHRRISVQAATGLAVEGLTTSLQSVREGLSDVGAFLGRAASACQVGVSTGSGGPVLVLAVLGLATALDRRRVLHTRLSADEEAPEFLYAWDVISPG